MNLKRALSRIFLAATIGFATLPALAPTHAEAADVGFCATPQAMTKVLKAEGQRSLATGNQRILFEELADGSVVAVDKQVGLIFTADKQGKVGYVLQSDKPAGVLSTKMCVSLRMHDVKLYDVRKPELPQEILLTSTAEAAAKKCDELAAKGATARGECGFHNDMLTKLSHVGERVMLQGQGVTKQDDGAWQPNGTLITVTSNMTGDKTERDGRGAIQFSTLPEGASILASVFTGTAYTQTALAELR